MIATRFFVGQTLTDYALNGFGRTLNVLNAQGGAFIIPEIKLAKVALQVLFGHMMINAIDAALQDGEIAFDGIRMRVAPNIFADAVVNGVMPSEQSPENAVLTFPIGHQGRCTIKMLDQNWLQVLRRHRCDMTRTHLCAALDKREDGFLGMSEFLCARR